MGIPVLIMGKSGSGKSTSLRNFAGNVGLINVLGKPLPFRNDGAIPSFVCDDATRIASVVANTAAPSVVIDDAGYIITNSFMRGHGSTGQGNDIFKFYNKIADDFWNLIQAIPHSTPPERIVYMMMHEDKNDSGDIKPKTIGKVLDEKVCIEGMFTIVLRSEYTGGRYVFHTRTNGFDVAKTPIGMFDDDIIDNDLKFVDDKIREYYNIELKTEDKITNDKT